MKEYQTSIYRTHLCSELRGEHIGQTVTLSGWIQRKRDHGGILFIDLRDNYGLTQVVVAGEGKDEFDKLRVESVVTVTGEVVARSEETINSKLDTGHVEVKVSTYQLHSACEVLPFQIAEDDQAPEATRLKYRFLELRREKLHQNIIKRSQITQEVRNLLHGMGFHEFQTPILTASSPEGARDFLVPSRLHPGKFFALPQAPQMFKQLVQVSGFDRYFQIAPCFRDEDARADRSPGEFYQIDMELSFVEQGDVFRVNENLMYELFTKFSDWKVTPKPFPQIPYKECLAKYGSDKPDLRIPLEIENVSAVFEGTEFRVFAGVLESGGKVLGLKVPVAEIPPRKYFDDAIDHFKKKTGSGLAYLIFHDEGVKGSIQKFISEKEIEKLRSQLSISEQSIVFFAAGAEDHILPWFGKFRVETGKHFGMVEENSYRFCWVVDYPLYERDPKTGKIDFSHNPFGMPKGGIEAFNTDNPLEIFSAQYDLVCNGYEFGSGSIRNHRPDIMYKAFEVVGYSKEAVDRQFSGMINAFQYGAPPHGGFAHGLDRIVMLLTREEAIREVIMYPLAQSGEDLMMGAPSEVTAQQLKDIHIQLDLPEELGEG